MTFTHCCRSTTTGVRCRSAKKTQAKTSSFGDTLVSFTLWSSYGRFRPTTVGSASCVPEESVSTCVTDDSAASGTAFLSRTGHSFAQINKTSTATKFQILTKS